MKYALVYGLLSGIVIVGVILVGILLPERGSAFSSEWFGYLVMLVALSFIFIGVKRYRDVECGGVVRFGRAFFVGLGIAAVAAAVYILVWEIYLASTGYRFMDQYLAGHAHDLRAQGVSSEEVARRMAEMEWMREAYRNPLMRIAITFAEIFPVGFVVALVSAALLRFPRLLQARSPAASAGRGGEATIAGE